MPLRSDNDANEDTPRSPHSKRNRVANACDACKARKKRCDGQGPPCGLCARLSDNCVYSSRRPRKSIRLEDRDGQPVARGSRERVLEPALSEEDSPRIDSVNANSSARFSALVSITNNEVERTKTAQRVKFYGWNLGLRSGINAEGFSQSVFRLLPLSHLEPFIERFFETINPFYDLLSREEVTRWCELRTQLGSTVNLQLDGALSMIATLGCLFSNEPNLHLESSLFQNAKLCLNCTLEDEPTPLLVIGWLLRSIYLRAVGSPQSAWMTICTAVRLVEVLGLHSDAVIEEQNDDVVSSKTCQKLRWIPSILYAAMAFELGRTFMDSRLASRRLKETPTVQSPSMENDVSEMELMLRCFDILEPRRVLSAEEIDALFDVLIKIDAANDAVGLSKCTLVLAVYRRRYMANPAIPSQMKQRVLEIGRQNLDAIERLLTKTEPWWNLSQVPVQLLCVLLVMDIPPSLALIDRTLSVLKAVTSKYDTVATREALAFVDAATRETLERKERETQVLRSAIRHSSVDANDFGVASPACTAGQMPPGGATDTIYNNEVPSLDNFNWDMFWCTGTAPFGNSNFA